MAEEKKTWGQEVRERIEARRNRPPRKRPPHHSEGKSAEELAAAAAERRSVREARVENRATGRWAPGCIGVVDRAKEMIEAALDEREARRKKERAAEEKAKKEG